MMLEIVPRLLIGDQTACVEGTPELAVVHACKYPCHQQAVGYTGNLLPEHPQYLGCEEFYDLYLNLIDPPTPLFKLDSFAFFREFAHGRYIEEGMSLLIHCNQGNSWAPALVYLAKAAGLLVDDSYTVTLKSTT